MCYHGTILKICCLFQLTIDIAIKAILHLIIGLETRSGANDNSNINNYPSHQPGGLANEGAVYYVLSKKVNINLVFFQPFTSHGLDLSFLYFDLLILMKFMNVASV